MSPQLKILTKHFWVREKRGDSEAQAERVGAEQKDLKAEVYKRAGLSFQTPSLPFLSTFFNTFSNRKCTGQISRTRMK